MRAEAAGSSVVAAAQVNSRTAAQVNSKTAVQASNGTAAPDERTVTVARKVTVAVMSTMMDPTVGLATRAARIDLGAAVAVAPVAVVAVPAEAHHSDVGQKDTETYLRAILGTVDVDQQ